MTEGWLYIQTEVYPALLKGFWVSLQLIAPSALCGLVIGIMVGVLRIYGNRHVMVAANTFVAIFRGSRSSSSFSSGTSASPTSGST